MESLTVQITVTEEQLSYPHLSIWWIFNGIRGRWFVTVQHHSSQLRVSTSNQIIRDRKLYHRPMHFLVVIRVLTVTTKVSREPTQNTWYHHWLGLALNVWHWLYRHDSVAESSFVIAWCTSGYEFSSLWNIQCAKKERVFGQNLVTLMVWP
jgi:hypothetical protein